MHELKDLYQEVIVDHNRSPRNFGKLEGANRVLEGYNPLCGDRLTLYLNVKDNRIENIAFDGSGCAISVASASLMTETIKGKSTGEAEGIFHSFHDMVTTDSGEPDFDKMGKLVAIAGVRDYPTRVKCATLCWHTLHSIIQGERAPVSTE